MSRDIPEGNKIDDRAGSWRRWSFWFYVVVMLVLWAIAAQQVVGYLAAQT
ncbi:hypothetical protein ACFSUD_18140 [Sulfitobacter aestuarii]|uniref:DUF2474 domain-containing protein n=1 Tax=Sulfitobacter aestuarii TaxID=2161676 RepID=A0ABW5U6H1_9RHOB